MAFIQAESGGSPMRLATMVTPRGMRLHVKARSGYVDVADGTGDPALSTLRGLLEAGAMEAARGLADADTDTNTGTGTGTGTDGADTDAAAADARLRGTVESIFQDHLAPEAQAEGTPEHVIAFLHERMTSSSPTGLMVMGRYLLTCPDRTAELASLDRPAVLVLYGENDEAWRPAVQEQMARRLGAHRVCIPGAGHSPAVEAPETTASTLTAFWRAAEDGERRRAAEPRPGGDQSGRAAPEVPPDEAKASA
jgi:pimeloyl-ACP methyl ester carboxylesterase